MNNFKQFTLSIGGRDVVIETGKYAEQTNGSCVVRCGETAVMVSVCMSPAPRDGMDFFPLQVDYEEKMFSIGKIPGGFKKREGRASDKAILTARLIDRPLRPLFPKGLFNDVVVTAQALSVEPDISPEPLAMIGSSVALAISDIPWAGPTGSVVVGLVDGKYVINPDLAQREKSRIHLNLAGTKDAILMIEAGADEVTNDEMVGAITFGFEEIKKMCVEIEEKIVPVVGKPKKEIELYHVPEELDKEVRAYADKKIDWAIDTFDRQEREARQNQAEEEVLEHFAEIYPENKREIKDSLYYLTKEKVRAKIFDKGIRPDGRGLKDVRPIWCERSVLPRAHGSAVFTRGQTQTLTTCTLAMLTEAQKLEGLDEETKKRYMHQYNFPGYCTGEAKALRSPGRREIGHGALAERALIPVLPSEEDFPYAIRVVNDIMSSNGSSSMASVCGSTMALMDAGVPIKAPVAGVAMGLIKNQETGEFKVLTDIQGLEDFLGDMDFKVAGTVKGITAIQMDIKIKGISEEIMHTAINQANEGRQFILSKMLEVVPEVSPTLSKYAPKIIYFEIDPEKIGDVIGKQGSVIKKIMEETGTEIEFNDDDSGRGYISAVGPIQNAERAKAIIMSIAHDPEVGDMFIGTVVRVIPIGAFIEFAPGKDGMIHISKLSNKRVEKVEDVVNIGDTVKVEIIKISDKGVDFRLLEKLSLK